ncbi:hypothetical protein V492_05220 [Pseudogymnoascus sp. VKM F-4246]|nr:hypothetical protein V492_05220 [Pseudogymnoascus sp. VKM F-4246]
MASASVARNERSPIAILRKGSNISEGEHDIRLDDYLNDKLQTAADFQNLDSLIANVEEQRVQLLNQLQDARSKLAKSNEEAAAHSDTLLQRTKAFQDIQSGIDRRLAIVTASDAPDEAVQRFKAPIEKLRRLDLAYYYVEMLQEVDRLANEARGFLPDHPKEALKPYARLKELSISLRRLQTPADDAAGHLVTHVEQRANILWSEMKQVMVDNFESILKKTDWPTASEAPTEAWTASFQRLLELQTPEILNAPARDPMVLLPMACLTKPFVQQFRYHFMGTKASNTKLHPAYFLQWVVELVESREDYLIDNVGPILMSHFGSTMTMNRSYNDPVAAFITALLPVVREKVNTLMVSISNDASVLSSFMVSLMKFDEDIRLKFNYDGGNSKKGWKGLTREVLDKWFLRWLEVEKEFALMRFKSIIKSDDNSGIDYDSTGPNTTKATYGASKVMDLLGNVTKQYQGLPKFSFQMRFVIDIQIRILDEYHGLLKDSLDAYIAITSTVGRALHGVTKKQQAQMEGTGGLESLCKVYGSSDYVINTLNDWSNELFFLGLWIELQERAKKRSMGDNLAEAMSYEAVKSSTSESVGSGADGAVFDETVNAYTKQRNHAELLMTESIKHSLPATLRAYTNKPNWLTVDISEAGVQAPMSITAEFEAPLQILERDMSFLHNALATATFRRIFGEVFEFLGESIWRDVLMREKFTRNGAAQFYRDLSATWSLIDNYIANGSSSDLGMPKLREAATLLNLPDTAQDGLMSFTDASDRAFASNAGATGVLEELHFKNLTYNEVRLVLDRRQG